MHQQHCQTANLLIPRMLNLPTPSSWQPVIREPLTDDGAGEELERRERPHRCVRGR
jgi:hypothetical protein